MAKRLAVTIAGAVSLGSYEAGVLYELMEAIRTHNTKATENEKIYVDVITGASAGGMTAAMVAQRLMYDGKALQGEFTNALYEAWVKNISLMQLVKMGWGEKKWHSLLSSDLVESIGHRMLIQSMEGTLTGPHAAVEQIEGAPQRIRVGLALTNLNGIDYMIPILGNPDGGFNYTTSVDRMTFEVTGDKSTDATGWQQMCYAAVGSGAFPAAFRPQPISRSADEFGDRLPIPLSPSDQGKTFVDWSGRSPADFAYSDGGVLQNQPLGIAKNLVDDAVAERGAHRGPAAFCDGSDRLYVFVAPHSVKSTAEKLHAQKITIWDELKQLVHVYLRQAVFHDWIVAEGMNQNIRLLDNRASGLAKVIAQGAVDIHALFKAASDLNRILIGSVSDEQGRLARLQEQYNIEYSRVEQAAGTEGAKAFISALATLEAAAQLESRDKMKIVAVVADPQKELAGSGLASFVGFFQLSFREHDYWVGRVKTRAYLKRPDVKQILGVTSWPQEEEWNKDLPNTSGVKLPLSVFQLARAAFIPAVIFVLLRPVLVLILALIGGLVLGVRYLPHH